MESILNIFFSCPSNRRPPISYRVREYYNIFLTNEIFKSKMIQVKEGWRIYLLITFLESTPRFTSSNIILGKGFKSVSSEKVKIYEMIVPLKLLINEDSHFQNVIDILQDCLCIFFTSTYKKITYEKMKELWSEVDINYLKSIPYPAKIPDQKYVGDIVREDGSVYIY